MNWFKRKKEEAKTDKTIDWTKFKIEYPIVSPDHITLSRILRLAEDENVKGNTQSEINLLQSARRHIEQMITERKKKQL